MLIRALRLVRVAIPVILLNYFVLVVIYPESKAISLLMIVLSLAYVIIGVFMQEHTNRFITEIEKMVTEAREADSDYVGIRTDDLAELLEIAKEGK